MMRGSLNDGCPPDQQRFKIAGGESARPQAAIVGPDRRTSGVRTGIAIVLVMVSLRGTAGAQGPDVLITGRYVAPDGSLQSDAAVVLSSGKIKTIRSADQYAGKKSAVRYPQAVLCPGLIDLRGMPGAFGNRVETARAIDPGVSMIDGIDVRHRHFRRALESGVTTVMITPSFHNIVSGASAVMKTGGADPARRVLRDDGPLTFAFGSSVLMKDRAPTSRMGALSMLREALAAARRNAAHPRLNAMAQGKLDAVVYAERAMDVEAALRELADFAGRVTLIHTGDVHELGAELALAHRAIIVGPFAPDMPPRVLSCAGAFARAGVTVALAGEMPIRAPDALRMTAALAVRYGMKPKEARRAITSVAAELAGVEDRVGAIKPGLDADLVVFSDDPLRPDARVLDVYIDGVRLYHASALTSAPTRDRPFDHVD